MKLKRLLSALLITTMLLLVVGCGNNQQSVPSASSSQTPSVNEPGASEKPELVIARFSGTNADDQKIVVEKYPDGKVIIDDVAYGQLKQKEILSAQSPKGTAGNYDAIYVASQWVKEYAEAGYIMPINDFIDKSGLDTDIYSKGMMDNITFDGNIYGFPGFGQTMIFAYDSEVLKNDNLEAPKSIEELVDIARFYKEKGSGIALAAKQGTASVTLWSQILFSLGGYYYNDNGEFDLTTEKAVYAAKMYDELAKYSLDGSTGWWHEDVVAALATQKTPIAIPLSGVANTLHDPDQSNVVDTVAYSPIYGHDELSSANLQFWIWAIPANAKDPDASYKLIEWLNSPAIEKEQSLMNMQISAIDENANDPEILAISPYLPTVMTSLADGKVDPTITAFPQIKDIIAGGLSKLATTDADPADVMAECQEAVNKLDLSK